MNPASTQHLRVTDGASLFPAIEQWVASSAQQAGWVRGFGTVSHCTLRVSGDSRHVGPAPELHLASLDVYFETDGKTVTLRASAVIGVDAHGVSTTVAGELVEATALDVVLTRLGASGVLGEAAASTQNAASGAGRSTVAKTSKPAKKNSARPPAASPSAAPSAASTSPRSSGAGRDAVPRRSAAPTSSPADWAQVSAMSQQIQSGALDEYENDIDVDELKPNDILLHPSLNRCLVVRVEGDDAVRVRVPNGSVRKLMMRPFRLIGTDTPRTYRIQKK